MRSVVTGSRVSAWSARRAVAWLGVALVLMVVPVSLAVAAVSGWSVQPTPSPTNASGSIRRSSVDGVSCPSLSVCTAVGWYQAGNKELTLAMRWDGTKWRMQRVPSPPHATSSFLSGVSCPSKSACVAVGDYSVSGTNDLPLVERWDGKRWRIQFAPGKGSLNGVSCSSRRVCTAVGNSWADSGKLRFTLAERWNGRRWRIQPTPTPTAGVRSSALDGVSCPSRHICTAVGGYRDSSNKGLTLAERWNGRRWRIQPTPNPAGFKGSGLGAVSCPSRSICTAVGSSNDGRLLTLAERWEGNKWSIQPTPNPSNAGISELDSVSCPSENACTAVGPYYIGGSFDKPSTLAERWDGTSWTIQPTPKLPKRGQFRSVSCPTPSACTAVGNLENFATLAERWSGS